MGRQLSKPNHRADCSSSTSSSSTSSNTTRDAANGNATIGRLEEPNPSWRNRAIYSLLNPLTTTNLKPVEFQPVGPLSRWLGNVSIRWVITVPFIVQIVTAAAVVGYLSFRNGQATADALIERLQSEIGDRVSQQLDDYLQEPQDLVQINQRAYELGFLDVQDLDRMQRYFYQQMVLSNSLSYINFASADGSLVGVGRDDDGLLYVKQIKPTEPEQMQQYRLNGGGDRTQLLGTSPYDPRSDVGYTAAITAGKPIWTNIYQWPDQPGIYSISASYPIYQDPTNPDTLVGVFGADFILSQVNQFLADLMTDSIGQVFIVERSSGLLIASSTTASPFGRINGESAQVRADASNNQLIRETATYLDTTTGGMTAVTQPQSWVANVAGDRHYIRVMPWQDPRGLDWVIVAVVPRSETVAQINANAYITLFLCVLALLVAIAIGIRTTQWITQPILFLNHAAKNLAGGAWNQTFVLQRSDEVGELAQSFNEMARQLRHSFRDLEKQKDSFARFFPPEYLAVLDKPDINSVRLGDHVSREMAVMFSDIRGFTSLSEAMTPRETFDFVNNYLEEVAPAVRMHNGVIIKFLGDGTMAVFPDSADSAVNAGLDTFHALNLYNRRRSGQGLDPIHIGIGLHVGYMMVGIVGERNRMQADAISDTVNLTARLEGLTKFYGVSFLISGQVVEDLSDPDRYQLRFLGEAIVKGRKEPISIYEVVDVDNESDRHLKQQTLIHFNDGIQYYRDGAFTAAKSAFERVLAIHPQDQPAQNFLNQIEDYLGMDKPENWTGVWQFATK